MGFRILTGDCLRVMAEMEPESFHCCVTSPPYYGLRDYGHDGQIGLEPTPDAYVARMVEVFRELRRVLRDDGTLWLNLGDSYTAGAGNRNGLNSSTLAGSKEYGRGCLGDKPIRGIVTRVKPKDLLGIPWRVAFALQADGWYLRQDIIWHKPNPMPESVTDRCTKAHEYVFLLSKSKRYYYDATAIAEPGSTSSAAAWYRENAVRREKPAGSSTLDGNTSHQSGLRRPGWQQVNALEHGRNRRSVWTITTKPYSGAHFATMPPDLVKPCILAGCPIGGTVLDPFAGAGTTLLVADRLQRNAVGIELNPAYADMARARISDDAPLFNREG